MEVVKGFFDYCIADSCVTSGNFEKTAKRLLELGYRTIAVNQIIDEANLEQKKKKKKGESRDVTDVVPCPVDIKKIEGCDELKILNRLTIVFSNQDIINKIIKSPNFKKFHIVAVQPTTQQAFQFTCSSIEADIFSFDPENKLTYKLNRKLYNQLVDRGFHFEILYSPAVQDSTKRKNTIAVSHMYHSYGKSKNIIISSGATNDFLLRSPYDIINLGLILGLGEEKAKNAILNSGRNVFIRAVGRRHGKVIMLAKNAEETCMEDEASSDNEVEEMELEPAQKKSKQ